MVVKAEQPVFDGTTGRGNYAGRRTHIIMLLRNETEPVTVDEVASKVRIASSTARFHLEALVDAGLAVRESQPRTTPGRPKAQYMGIFPNQAHERAHSFQFLAEILTKAIARSNVNAGERMYREGFTWGHCLAHHTPASHPTTADAAIERLADKLDAMWFAPEIVNGEPPRILLHNCPFMDSSTQYPHVVCQLHAGMINGCLERMGAEHRMTHLYPMKPGHQCEGSLAKTTVRLPRVKLELPTPHIQRAPENLAGAYGPCAQTAMSRGPSDLREASSPSSAA